MALTPATRLSPYEIGTLLGEGGMGQVYLARDTKLNRDVALKLLPASVAQEPERLARFRREAQVLARSTTRTFRRSATNQADVRCTIERLHHAPNCRRW